MGRRRIADMLDDLRDACSGAFATKDLSTAERDLNDPHNWDLAQLKAYLRSSLPPGRAQAKLDSAERDALVRRCCELTGRTFRQSRPTDEEIDALYSEERDADWARMPSRRRSEQEREQAQAQAQRTTVAQGHTSAAGATAAGDHTQDENIRHRLFRMAGAALDGAAQHRRGAAPQGEANMSESFVRERSFQRRLFRKTRLQQLFPILAEEGYADLPDGAETIRRRGRCDASIGSTDKSSSSSSSPDESFETEHCEAEVAPATKGGSDTQGAPPTGPRADVPTRERRGGDAEQEEAKAYAGNDGERTHQQPRRRRREREREKARGMSNEAETGDGEEQTRRRRAASAAERRHRRETTFAQAEHRRSQTEHRRDERRRKERSSHGRPRSSGGEHDDADAAAEIKRAAAKRVAEWSHSKDFYAMLQTLNEFKGLELSKGIGTSRQLGPGATAAQLKKAFHRASLSLHPDRLVNVGDVERAQAEEVFKVLSSSYDEARSAAEALSA